jgi:hypothetical protein
MLADLNQVKARRLCQALRQKFKRTVPFERTARRLRRDDVAVGKLELTAVDSLGPYRSWSTWTAAEYEQCSQAQSLSIQTHSTITMMVHIP